MAHLSIVAKEYGRSWHFVTYGWIVLQVFIYKPFLWNLGLLLTENKTYNSGILLPFLFYISYAPYYTTYILKSFFCTKHKYTHILSSQISWIWSLQKISWIWSLLTPPLPLTGFKPPPSVSWVSAPKSVSCACPACPEPILLRRACSSQVMPVLLLLCSKSSKSESCWSWMISTTRGLIILSCVYMINIFHDKKFKKKNPKLSSAFPP